MQNLSKPRLLGSAVVLILFVSLACNIPRPLARFTILKSRPNHEDEIDREHEIVEELDATLVSPEGEVVGLKPPHGTDWVCVDVAGEVSEMENTVAFYADTMKLNKAVVTIELSYDGEDNWMRLNYLTEFDRDLAVLGEDDQIAAWNHEVWSNAGSSFRMQLWDMGAFEGSMNHKTTTTVSYPQSATSTIEATYHVFGLVDPMNYRRAYLCNVGRNPLPENLGELTVENFLDYCNFYYYECTEK